MSWIHITLEFLIGCGLLAWSADRFVTASASLAKHFGMPAILIGMLLVGFGTSFPELVVSAIASFKGNAGIAIGNAVGSNIANVGLVVGLTALFIPLSIHSQLLKREFPILIGVTIVVWFLILNQMLSHIDGLVLLILLVVHLFWLIRSARSAKIKKDIIVEEYEKELPPEMSLKKSWFWWGLGLVLLFVASDLLVSGASSIARWLNVSELMIGLTVVAVGTSLPELAATFVSARRGEHDIAIGNVVGSCIFNLLAVLMMPAFISPTRLSQHLLYIDYPIMLGFVLALWIFSQFPIKAKKIGRLEALVLFIGFVGYLIFSVFVSKF